MSKLKTLLVCLGVTCLAACAAIEEEPAEVEGRPEPLLVARAAVEVAMIEVPEMREFQARVEQMSLGDTQELWLELGQLHGHMHATDDLFPLEEGPGGSGECSRSPCSSSFGCDPQWCCAFGENATFYTGVVPCTE